MEKKDERPRYPSICINYILYIIYIYIIYIYIYIYD